MSWIIAVFLGAVQGLTEFLPVSSSGHLQLVRLLFGIEGSRSFDLVCHLGTLTAILVYLRRDLLSLLRDFRSLLLLAIGTLPLLPLPFFRHSALLSSPFLWGCCFLVTGLLLLLASRVQREPSGHRVRDVLCIGALQALALFPGISRSGATISGARLLGWRAEDAVRFSFLLALPAIVGAMVLEVGTMELSPSIYLTGLLTSFGVGLGALALFFRLLSRGRLAPFAYYCLAVGLLTLVML